ncbi:hypothetical protein ACM39_02190 [Chryseobacterium sp. FH2]|uniref:hypothetical protein n=1 Tax=Chryseobacterium sp. FH2 TaxID=1674291 RepID=UPI00065B047C|nr:hypothetical protein [Chryseobacterium sp. FH2]KMQ69871.1 hypothetical protein ACM39_02190 [Chryseobacterium sp. FH2]
MKKIKFSILLLGVFGLIACDKKEDEVHDVNKKASIETELSVQHLDSTDILITKHKIWKNNKLFKEIIKRDTIPGLGDTIRAVKDEAGHSHVANAKKDYEFFITVQ